MAESEKLSSPVLSPVSLPVQNGFVVVQSNCKEMYKNVCFDLLIFFCRSAIRSYHKHRYRKKFFP